MIVQLNLEVPTPEEVLRLLQTIVRLEQEREGAQRIADAWRIRAIQAEQALADPSRPVPDHVAFARTKRKGKRT